MQLGPGCHIWIKLSRSWTNHQTICPATILGISEYENMQTKEIRLLSMCASGRIETQASQTLREEVFISMKDDEISRAAQNDSMIIGLGHLWLLKNTGNQLKRKYYTSHRMQDAARLLLNLRQQTQSDLTMSDFLSPEHFDSVVKAALTTASLDFDDEDDLKDQSATINLESDIKRMVVAKWAMCLKNHQQEEISKCSDFLKLMKLEWAEKMSKMAALQLRHFNREKSLLNPDALVKLHHYVKAQLEELKLDHSRADPVTFRRAVVLCQTRLLMYNKCRAREIEAIKIGQCVKRQTGVDVGKPMRSPLSRLETHLLKTQELMNVEGKDGRDVPVLVPRDIQPVLQYITDAGVRQQADINPANKYLFPNTNIGALRAYESMKKVCAEAQIRPPEKLTSTNVRKYVATVSQVLDLPTNQQKWLVQWLVDRLGHEIDVDEHWYCNMTGIIERVNIAKLALIQDQDLVETYAGKNLDEIQLTKLVFGRYTTVKLAPSGVTDEPAVKVDDIVPLGGFVDDELQLKLRLTILHSWIPRMTRRSQWQRKNCRFLLE